MKARHDAPQSPRDLKDNKIAQKTEIKINNDQNVKSEQEQSAKLTNTPNITLERKQPNTPNITLERKQPGKSNNAEEKLKVLVKGLLDRLNQLSKPLPDGDNWEVMQFKDTPVARALTTKEPVLKIPHKTKKFGNCAIAPKSTIIHLENHHADISSIKFNQFVDMSKTSLPSLPKLLITLEMKQDRIEYYVTDSEIVKLANELRALAAELNLAEFALTKASTEDNRVVPLKSWESGWEDPQKHGLWYDKVSDPMILDQYQSRVLPFFAESKDKELVVLDVGGGKGRLASKLISETLQNNIPVHYILLEPTGQIDQALDKMMEFKGKKNCRISLKQSTLMEYEVKEKAHCVISSGGPIDVDVASRETALEHVKKMEECLVPGGLLIATGQTGIIPKARQFNAKGLKVLSYATPCVAPKGYEDHDFIKQATAFAGFFGHYQRYVCQKPAVSEIQQEVKPEVQICCLR